LVGGNRYTIDEKMGEEKRTPKEGGTKPVIGTAVQDQKFWW
jgi:hypothetical protein